MIPLDRYPEPALFAGTVLVFRGEYPFDREAAQFMLCDYPASGEGRCPFALYCVWGYHSGSLEYVFPAEALAEGVRGIDTKWLRENWKQKVCGGCGASDVSVRLWDEK